MSLTHGAYEGLRKALTMQPGEVIDVVKASGLRGRGGAGFPAGMKWSFVPKDSPKPKYVCCNADESEPGTFKDHVLMERNPHLVLEGWRSRATPSARRRATSTSAASSATWRPSSRRAIAEARARGYLGTNIFGSGFDCDIHVHRGAGAYEAGEESALLESLEGKRAQPRLRPPFPAVVGLYGCPTVINNVETLANVPFIIVNGAGLVRRHRPGEERRAEAVLRQRPRERSPASTRRRCTRRCGSSSTTTRAASAAAGSSRRSSPADPRRRCCCRRRLTPRPASTASRKRARCSGSAAMIVMDDTTCMVWAAENLIHFYRHESCGKCTPCREGADWMLKILHKIERGEGEMRDLDLLESVARNINGKTLCPFGEAEVAPVLSTLQHFRHEYEAHIREGRCPLHADWRRGA